MFEQTVTFLNAHFDSLWWLVWWSLFFRITRGIIQIRKAV